MSFLAPLFLLGALTVALPVVFHLIRRTTRERQAFSSLMFLQSSPPRLTRRSRLEHLLLLLLRCAVIGLLAAGFARPFFQKPVVLEHSAEAKRRLFLLDTSASMRRADLWNDTRKKVGSLLRQSSPADEVAIFACDRQLQPVLTFQQWNDAAPGERVALAENKLAGLRPGWSGTHLGSALMQAAERIADANGKAPSGPSELVLISDLQEGSRIEVLQGYEWPRGLRVTLEPLKPKHASNAALQLVGDPADAAPEPATNLTVRVRVTNAGDSKREQFKVGWARSGQPGFAATPVSVYVPPGRSRTLPVLVPTASQGLDRLVLEGDDEEFDNVVFALPPAPVQLNVVYLGPEAETDPKQPLYFLQRAFQDTRRQAVRVVACPPDQPVRPDLARSAALFVLTAPMERGLATGLRAQVAGGAMVLVVLQSPQMAATLAQILDLSSVGIEEAQVRDYAMLAEVDFRHPLFAPFADPRFSDFTKIHFWKHRRLEVAAIPGAQVRARFDDGDPALVEAAVGRGRVWVLTAGWQPAESQLALSTKFVPLLYSLLDQCGGATPLPNQYLVGDTVPLGWALGPTPTSGTIRTPDGTEIALAAGQTNFTQALVPGIYTIGSVQPPRRFAVNLDPVESRTAPLAPDEFERLGVPVTNPSAPLTTEAEKQRRLQNAELESRQKLWRWCVAGALLVALMETWLAGRTTRQAVVQGEAVV